MKTLSLSEELSRVCDTVGRGVRSEAKGLESGLSWGDLVFFVERLGCKVKASSRDVVFGDDELVLNKAGTWNFQLVNEGSEHSGDMSEKANRAGRDVYKKLRVGDSVIDDEGKDLSKDPNFCTLNHKSAERLSDGSIHFDGEGLRGKIDFYLSKREWAELKKKF